MVNTIPKTFKLNPEDSEALLKELKKFHITPEKKRDSYSFSIQHDNSIYNVELLRMEEFTTEEKCFMLNTYPYVKTFDDIQMKIFGRVIW